MFEVFAFIAGAVLAYSFRGQVAKGLHKLGFKAKGVEAAAVNDLKSGVSKL